MTAGNVTDAPDKISEGAAERNRTVATTGCGILSLSMLPFSCKEEQDQIGNTVPIGKLCLQDNCKAKLPESETCIYRENKIFSRNSILVKIYLAAVQSLVSKFFFWIHFNFNVFISNDVVEWHVYFSNRNLNLGLKKKKKNVSELRKQHFSIRICFIFMVQWLKQYRNLTCKTEFISQCLSEGRTYGAVSFFNQIKYFSGHRVLQTLNTIHFTLFHRLIRHNLNLSYKQFLLKKHMEDKKNSSIKLKALIIFFFFLNKDILRNVSKW